MTDSWPPDAGESNLTNSERVKLKVVVLDKFPVELSEKAELKPIDLLT